MTPDRRGAGSPPQNAPGARPAWVGALQPLDALDLGWELLRLGTRREAANPDDWRAAMLAMPEGVGRQEASAWARGAFLADQRRWWAEVGGSARARRELMYAWLAQDNREGAWRLAVLEGADPGAIWTVIHGWDGGALPDGGPTPLPWGWLESPPRAAEARWDGPIGGAGPPLLGALFEAEREEVLWAALRLRHGGLEGTAGEAALQQAGFDQEDLGAWAEGDILGWLGIGGAAPLSGAEVLLALTAGSRGTEDLKPFGAQDRLWRLLVRGGMEPAAAMAAAKRTPAMLKELPTGQWVPEELRTVIGAHLQGMQLGTLWLETADVQEAARLIGEGQFIEAIKYIRRVTSAGLREAKEAGDELRARGADMRRRLPRPRRQERGGGWALIEAGIDRLLIVHPLHWVVLSAIRIVEDPLVPTMAVASAEGGGAALFYNPTFAASLTVEERAAVLAHEVNHLIFNHLDRPYNVEEGPAWRIACECTANEFVRLPLPGRPILLQQFGLPPGESTHARYLKLVNRDDLPDLPWDVLRWSVRALATRHDDRSRAVMGNVRALIQSCAELVAGEVDETELRAIGANGGGWAEQLFPDGIGAMPWEEVLARSVRGLLVRYATRRHPSRRQPELVGIVPGRRSRREAPSVLFVVDTSGSMTAGELTQIGEELNGLIRRNVRVTFMQCDDAIREEVRVTPGFTFSRAKGRGGTSFLPPFSPEVLRRVDPDLIVYFTDGYGPAPASAPAGVSVLWVLTGPHPARPATFGEVTAMRPRAQRARVQPVGSAKPV